MNEIKIKVKFKKGLCYSQGIKLVQNDYNSTKLVFEFDDDEGTKIFELRDSDDNVILADEIVNNELILARFDEHDNAYPIFTKEGEYIYEVSLYKDNSKLTSASDKFKVNAEQVIIDGEIVETYTPMFDNLLSDLAGALQETDNIDIDVEKIGNTSTVTITKKDGQQETVQILDGEKGDTGEKGEKGDTGIIGPQGPQGPQGIQGPIGPQGKAFTISKTYSSISEMNADFNNMEVGDYVMIASSVELEDNAKLYVKGEEEWLFVSDFSGAMGIQGEQGIQGPQGPQGIQGVQGIQGIQGETGNGIATIQKTSTSGLIDTYTITYTDGNMSTFSITNGKDGEDGEVSQEQLDETNSHLDYLSKVSNLFEKITATGTNITLNDTSDTIMKLNLDTTTSSQATTTGRNLLPNSANSTTSNGITFTVNDDGTITLNGTNNNVGSSTIFLITEVDNFSLNAGTYYTIATGYAGVNIASYDGTNYKTFAGGSGNSFTLDSNTNFRSVYLQVGKGTATTFNNVKIYPIVSTTAVTINDYEPYTGGQPAPSPSYPQEIHVIKGNNEIKISNKNLIESVQRNGNSLFFNGTSSQTEYIFKAGTYTLSFVNENVTSVYIKTTSTNARSLGSNSPKTFTSDEDFNIWIYRSGMTSDETTNIQLEEGSIATEYVTHKEQTYPINLGDIEFCGIGDYKDVLFKNTLNSEYYDSSLELNKWYKLNRITTYQITGNENWSLNNTSTTKGIIRYGIDNMLPLNILNNARITVAMAKYFKGVSSITTNAETQDTPKYCISGRNIRGLHICVDLSNNSLNTLDNFKTWLTNNSVVVYYVLATPTYTLLNDTLQTQLDNLQYALAYDTQTNISQTNTDLPFVINAETYVDLTDCVKNTDYATNNKGGVFKTSTYYATKNASDGTLYCVSNDYSTYQSRDNNQFISKGTLENVITGKGLDLKQLPSYDNTKTQVLKNINGTLTWVDE